jgi:hypothetical protein
MPPHQFENLRERLLCGGVAPRHVRRYLRELRDHYDDLLSAELARGADLATARETAWARLGTEESLARGMLERPELRSKAARFPALVFGVVPVLTWLGAPIALAAASSLLPEGSRRAEPSAAFIDACYTLCLLYTRAVPVLLGAAALEAAARRRLRARWALVGTGAVDVLAGTAIVHVFPGQLGVTSSLLPWLLPFSDAFGPKDATALGEGLLRAALLLALGVIVQQLAWRLWSSDRPTLPAA